MGTASWTALMLGAMALARYGTRLRASMTMTAATAVNSREKA